MPLPEAWRASTAEEVLSADQPTPGFASVATALEAVAAGRLIVVMDDEDRENEGDLICAAEKATPELLAFVVRHTSGVVCVSMESDLADRLDLPLMVNDKVRVWRGAQAALCLAGAASGQEPPPGLVRLKSALPAQDNVDRMRTAFCVTCDLKVCSRAAPPPVPAQRSRGASQDGVSTGISASDRAATIAALANPASTPATFTRPGHIFPLRARDGGVLTRAGHTEAAVDLARLAGCSPVGVLCEVVNEDGTMARSPQLREFGAQHNLPVLLISDLIRYRRARQALVSRTAVARLPTEWGSFSIYSYISRLDGIEHVAMVMGDIGDGQGVLARVHSECITGDIFASARCDCGPQLSAAMARVAREGRGVVVYLRGQEGRGIGLGHKLRAYNLQDQGRDTVQANEDLGLPVDNREYGVGAEIFRDLGVKSLRLMTNNPAKFTALVGHGLAIVGRVPLLMPVTRENGRYIETKRTKMGHYSGNEHVALGDEAEESE